MFIDLCLYQWIMNRYASGNVSPVKNNLFMRLQQHLLSALIVMKSIQSHSATTLKNRFGDPKTQKKWMMR